MVSEYSTTSSPEWPFPQLLQRSHNNAVELAIATVPTSIEDNSVNVTVLSDHVAALHNKEVGQQPQVCFYFFSNIINFIVASWWLYSECL